MDQIPIGSNLSDLFEKCWFQYRAIGSIRSIGSKGLFLARSIVSFLPKVFLAGLLLGETSAMINRQYMRTSIEGGVFIMNASFLLHYLNWGDDKIGGRRWGGLGRRWDDAGTTLEQLVTDAGDV